MKRSISAVRGLGLAALTVVLALSASTTSSAQPSGSEGRTIQGVWLIQVTIVHCTTRAPMAPPVHSLVTFAAGGTLQESVSGGGFAPGQRSDGHGLWTHKGGNTYEQTFATMVNFTTPPAPPVPGFEQGWMKIQHTVEMIDADTTRSAGNNTFYRLNGEVYRAGCSTATGMRLK